MSSDKKLLIVIPARLQSTRLPRKLLQPLWGSHTVLECTLRAVVNAVARIQDHAAIAANIRRPVKVAVASGDQEMLDCAYNAVSPFPAANWIDIEPVETTGDHANGTSRCAEVAEAFKTDDPDTILVNVQADEPFLPDDFLVRLLTPFFPREKQPEFLPRFGYGPPPAPFAISTLSFPISRRQEYQDQSCVKVVTDLFGRALYFSRAPIPFYPPANLRTACADAPVWDHVFQHVGVYAFSNAAAACELISLSRVRETPLAGIENLEQLKWLEMGNDIIVNRLERSEALPELIGIDTQDDLDRGRELAKRLWG